MKAIVKYAEGDGNIDLREVPEPEPAKEEVRIRVEAAGICGSDLHIYHGDIQIPMNPPFIIGHEFAGTIDRVGEGVDRWGKGDRVTAENSHTVCGNCQYCRTGSYNLCPDRLATGYAFDGAFARYCVVPGERVHKLPDNVDFISGALSDPVACACHAVLDLTGIRAGETVLITGPGPMGLICLQLVKSSGAKVILTGRSKDRRRLELGKKLGADVTIDVDTSDLIQVVKDITHGCGVDVVLECSGAASAARAGFELVRKQGKYTQVGLFGSPIEVDLSQLAYKELQVTGSFSQKYMAWEEALLLVSQGKIDVNPLVTDIMPLTDWKEGFRRFEEGEAIKVLFEPGREG